MNHVDRALLHTYPVYCYNYVAKFVGFSNKDVQAIKSVSERLAPLSGVVVDTVYDKLRAFDITWESMAKQHKGYAGKVVEKVQDLKVDSSQIKYRKDMLTRMGRHCIFIFERKLALEIENR
ncbi:hypothetical protein K493DRAFT_297910 [Basidiobolus meristosporus CBS 931.73]|uniref:Globin-sensor domain-containing protein n=1 Tax=Basidiobolus meristosporus CBS 931.73 TaxID=1314790 RepID=A0A1Y1YWY3_9FUNG|nr:hypothetical protein K493DRAFT_297910 [Basidiobolus meristosporus CBS 931.73]|eukprot:ORY02541.1 hypothetical protein K493DRAFT_297910 [Basidiobolus meristosporus CBS 931.73]